MYVFSLIFLFLVGSAIGSFLNVVSFRYRPDGKIITGGVLAGRSHCPDCLKNLRWYDLIPIASFIFLRRRCRSCGALISFQYPLVEIIGGVLLAYLPIHFYHFFGVFRLSVLNQSLDWYYLFLGVWILVAFALLLMAVIDYRRQIIPDQINLFLVALGILLVASRFFFHYFHWPAGQISFLGASAGFLTPIFLVKHFFINRAAAGLLGLIFFGGIVAATRGRGMGMGDVKLAGALGFLLGWPDAIIVFFLSFVIGALWSVGLMALRRKSIKDAVPFGPFLAAAVFVTIALGEKLLHWYFISFFNV